jgi:Uncharacterized protein conserved in bacteria
MISDYDTLVVVSMLDIVLELPEATSIKDKRRAVSSIKERLRTKFRLSCAEVDLLDSMAFAEIGAALVSNSKEFGESVMHKALALVEDEYGLRVHDAQIHSEIYFN